MMRRNIKMFLPLCFFVSSLAFGSGPVEATGREKCPVCGMFTKMYPKWATQIVFKDGSYEIFDGPKDAFKYYFNMSKYSKNRRQNDVHEFWTTEYYTTKSMQALDLYYVVGSDVMGPMGTELIPIKGEMAALEFMKDHSGERVLKFGEITAEHVAGM